MILYHLFPIILGLTTQTVSAERSQLLSQVNVLTGSTFDAIMKSSEDAVPVWLLDFYAPWCGHCKELAPVLESIVADKENDFIAIGTIDAPANRKLAEKFDVQGFPTLYWRYNGEDFLHTGSRSRESLMSYGRRLTGDAIVDVKDMTHFADDPVVYIFDGAEGEVGAKVAMKYKMDALFGRTPGSETAKKLCRVERGEEPLCEVFEEKWDDFVRKSNFPMLTALNMDTFDTLTEAGLPLVVASIELMNTKAESSVKSVAREFRKEGRFLFTTVDRILFREWLETFDMLQQNEDQYFIFDNKHEIYCVKGENEDLESFIRDVESGKGVCYRRVENTMFQEMAVKFSRIYGVLEENDVFQRLQDKIVQSFQRIWKKILSRSYLFVVPFLLIWVVMVKAKQFAKGEGREEEFKKKKE